MHWWLRPCRACWLCHSASTWQSLYRAWPSCGSTRCVWGHTAGCTEAVQRAYTVDEAAHSGMQCLGALLCLCVPCSPCVPLPLAMAALLCYPPAVLMSASILLQLAQHCVHDPSLMCRAWLIWWSRWLSCQTPTAWQHAPAAPRTSRQRVQHAAEPTSTCWLC
jgi:hypothetical protein